MENLKFINTKTQVWEKDKGLRPYFKVICPNGQEVKSSSQRENKDYKNTKLYIFKEKNEFRL